MIKEKDLTKIIIERLYPYFEIYPEIEGEFTHWDQKRTVRLDLGLFPKKHLIKNGFPKYFFGIEIKCFNLNTKEWTATEKTINTIHQCLNYKYSKFGKKKMEPAFILIADNFNIDDYKNDFENELFRTYIQTTIGYKQFAYKHNVGRIAINDTKIRFAMQNTFWSNESGFSNKELLNFYCGNRTYKQKPMTPVEF
jgi:hypothetical protein